MTTIFGSSNAMFLNIEANKENIPPGTEFKKESFVLPEPRVNRTTDPDHENLLPSPVPRPSPAMSQLSDASFLSQDGGAVNTSADEADDDLEVTSRKEKSLGLLCQRFLIAINEETVGSSTREVHLETVARKMNVEKRRIYDIVNVMEALDAMQKTNKSYYQWQGLESLPKLMFDLQNEAVEEGLPERVLRVEQAMCSFTELSSPRGKQGFKDIVGSFVSCTSTPTTPSTSFDSVTVKMEPAGLLEKRSRVDTRDRQGRNSLAQLCRRFLMVLLSNPKNIRKVSLDVASTVLIKDPETEGFEPPSRSRCRRLYDIANVLVALGLIKKVHYLFGTKKIPLFVYCGPEPDQTGSFDVFQSVERLLSSSQNVPQTPIIKAQTDKIVQQIAGFGKRTLSEQNLTKPSGNTPKIAKIKSAAVRSSPMYMENNLFMFAEVVTAEAAAEKMRYDAFAQLSRTILGSVASINSLNAPLTSSQHPMTSRLPPLPMAPLQLPKLPEIPKPQAQKQFTFPATSRPRFNFPDYTPVQSTIRPLVSQMTFPQESSQLHNLDVKPKHLMSNILGESKKFKNNQNTFEHTTSSAFQVVKKGETRPKKVFGEIQNLQ
ncbi:Transcription factor efl-3 [Caenorhabditis elegans]|uniref:Transcription factor efl-3 n=1 Tax=Caenorhabditis elegans TaxID=6239 RepID=EFL3_CAEEL|nr:Transcription factor efl-3 [Caenorhabditis elegans]Q20619.2 RecName: Full=Transcription factor efl-3; AltName: Full=E2F-like family member 3 [Caenorhabditis elegans]CAA91391.2 Transcription factor efl-3 [Caenorhabditis elegans]|eukprot:NP_495771.2 E2F-like (mammalian transcription factor) [Caenorhabditis elegans]